MRINKFYKNTKVTKTILNWHVKKMETKQYSCRPLPDNPFTIHNHMHQYYACYLVIVQALCAFKTSTIFILMILNDFKWYLNRKSIPPHFLNPIWMLNFIIYCPFPTWKKVRLRIFFGIDVVIQTCLYVSWSSRCECKREMDISRCIHLQ